MAMTRTVGVAVFRKTCARLIAQVAEQREPITITKHGRPVALLAPVPRPDDGRRQIIGALRGSVLGYDDPFAPAADPAEWDALR
ncbi:MAG: type II toxin-antitoxin system Phd/YefM family antitoxin [Gemmatimonadales bacterium]|nr:type II toxin-antitoxin system Phd/YefM family antitoxin [Gemmatimonadales bacterium]MYG48920.1 type II toxin-antitoxin system Phd/YefM family antitoxin [Gemmatimonadales bacterium]MYK02906.1 type II toxin-antitoxin system Phd/YefM family antitoxin [Candidatus Palauibacter ramosifaciens]